MAIHDAYARLTPYELFLPDPDFAEERFPDIEQEAEQQAADLLDPDAFVMLIPVGEALRELRGPEDDPERIREHGALLFHAYHTWRAEEPLFLLSTPAARYVVEGAPEPAELTPPTRAGYLQLPQHLFWNRAEEGKGQPESVDGFFWAAGGQRLSVLMASGLRRDRPGFSVVALPPLSTAEAASWATTTFREEGEDFRSAMPGAEFEGLYEIRTPGEILKLLVRAFAHLDRVEGVREEATPAEEGLDPEAPPPSRLPFIRIPLD